MTLLNKGYYQSKRRKVKGISKKIMRLSFRVSEEEYDEIISKGQKSNMNLSRYLSFSALDKEIFVFHELKEFAHQLSKIGTNLNQLALLANQGKISCVDIGVLKKVLKEIWQSLTLLTRRRRRTKQ